MPEMAPASSLLSFPTGGQLHEEGHDICDWDVREQ